MVFGETTRALEFLDEQLDRNVQSFQRESKMRESIFGNYGEELSVAIEGLRSLALPEQLDKIFLEFDGYTLPQRSQ